jgi:hypothetical protein
MTLPLPLLWFRHREEYSRCPPTTFFHPLTVTFPFTCIKTKRSPSPPLRHSDRHARLQYALPRFPQTAPTPLLCSRMHTRIVCRECVCVVMHKPPHHRYFQLLTCYGTVGGEVTTIFLDCWDCLCQFINTIVREKLNYGCTLDCICVMCRVITVR